MIFVKTFKGYEDKAAQLDAEVNEWVAANKVEVKAVNSVLSHETEGRAKSGDLIYTLVYRSDQPVP